MTLEAW